MSSIYFLPAAAFGKLKQVARRLKRDSGITHHEALEQTAKANGYANWHQVAQLASETQPSEIAYRSGFLLAFDIKDALDNSNLPNELFHVDNFAAYLGESELLDYYKHSDDEELELGHDKLSAAEFEELFNESFLGNLFFYRFVGSDLPATVQQAMNLASKYSFFPPYFVWFRGKFIKVFEDLSVDGKLNW